MMYTFNVPKTVYQWWWLTKNENSSSSIILLSIIHSKDEYKGSRIVMWSTITHKQQQPHRL